MVRHGSVRPVFGPALPCCFIDVVAKVQFVTRFAACAHRSDVTTEYTLIGMAVFSSATSRRRIQRTHIALSLKIIETLLERRTRLDLMSAVIATGAPFLHPTGFIVTYVVLTSLSVTTSYCLNNKLQLARLNRIEP